MTSPNQIVQDFIGAQRALTRQKTLTAPEHHQTPQEVKRLESLSPEDRTWERLTRARPLPEGEVTVGGERGPDEMERLTAGAFHFEERDAHRVIVDSAGQEADVEDVRDYLRAARRASGPRRP